MKKQILNLGKALTKAQQKSINGGGPPIECYDHIDCPPDMGCCSDKSSYPFIIPGVCMLAADYDANCQYAS